MPSFGPHTQCCKLRSYAVAGEKDDKQKDMRVASCFLNPVRTSRRGSADQDMDELHLSVDLCIVTNGQDQPAMRPKREKINEVSRRRGYQIRVHARFYGAAKYRREVQRHCTRSELVYKVCDLGSSTAPDPVHSQGRNTPHPM
jgi:hypothetical protein